MKRKALVVSVTSLAVLVLVLVFGQAEFFTLWHLHELKKDPDKIDDYLLDESPIIQAALDRFSRLPIGQKTVIPRFVDHSADNMAALSSSMAPAPDWWRRHLLEGAVIVSGSIVIQVLVGKATSEYRVSKILPHQRRLLRLAQLLRAGVQESFSLDGYEAKVLPAQEIKPSKLSKAMSKNPKWVFSNDIDDDDFDRLRNSSEIVGVHFSVTPASPEN